MFINPLKPETPGDLPREITWEFAQKEIAQAKGFATGSGAGLSKGVAALYMSVGNGHGPV